MNRSSAVIIFEDETGKWHCRMCLGVRNTNRIYRICCEDTQCFHLNRVCYSADGGTTFRVGREFRFNNKKHKIILSPSINLLPIKDDISHIVDQCVAYIQKLQEDN